MDCTENTEKNKDGIVKSIKSKIPLMTAEVNKMILELQHVKFLDVKYDKDLTQKTDTELYAKRTEEAKHYFDLCLQFSKQADKYRDQQQVLDMAIDKFEEVDAFKKDAKIKYDLWNSLMNWVQLTSKWDGSMFHEIDTDEISRESEKYSKIVVICSQLQDSTAVERLAEKVRQFKDTMPIVLALGNSKLQPRHWTQIKEIMKTELELEKKEFTLGQIIENRAADYSEQIQFISITATQESKLEDDLQKITEDWKGFSLPTQSSVTTEGALLFSSIEIQQDLIDDFLT